MKILFIGGLEPGQTSSMRMLELRGLGHEVRAVDAFERWNRIDPVSRRLQQWRCKGPTIDALNREVLSAIGGFDPELVWAEKQEYLRPETVEALKRTGARLLHYTPDPYFTLPWKRTKIMDQAMPLFDYLVTSKRYELDDYERLTAKVIYVPLGFSEASHRPVVPSSADAYRKFAGDVSFLGGWEPRREVLLDAIARNGVSLKVWGYGWDHLADGRVTPRRIFAMRRNSGGESFSIRRNPVLAAAVQGNEVYGDEYAWAISAARISVGFLRKICPDQHTTRTFEIPACGSMLLADRTDEHMDFFTEGVEAEFFDSEAELLDKIGFYLANEDARSRVAARGFERCHRSGYSYRSRIVTIMDAL
jgi:spore maturation protein CgeB